MKKIIRSLLAGVLALTLAACGSSGNKPEDKVKATINGFMSALTSAELDKIPEYYESDSANGITDMLDSLDSIYTNFEQMLGGSLDDDLKEELNSFISGIIKKAVKSYEIGEITKAEDGLYNAKVAIEFIDSSAMSKALQNIDLTDQIGALSSEYIKILSDKGQAEAQKYLYNEIIKIYNSNLDKILEGVEYTKYNSVFTVAEKDGNYKIRNIKGE